MFDCGLLVGDDVIVQPSLYRKGVNHSLHSIFRYLAHGYSHKKIKEMQCDILPETVRAVRDILVQRNPYFFPDTVSNRVLQDFKVLIDENLNPKVSEYLKTHFNKVAHIHDVKLTGEKDHAVLNWAMNNSYNIIFTKDSANETEKDLTYLATEDARSILRARHERSGNNFNLSDIPIIVHLPGGCDEEKELRKLLDTNREEFFDYLNNRASPYIDIGGGRILCGPTYLELRGENYVQENMISEAGLTYKKDTREFFKALWLGRLSAADLRDMNIDREAKVDTQINQYFIEFEERRIAREAREAYRLMLQERNRARLHQRHHASLA